MNRNTEAHFAQVPTIDIPRSTFPMEFENLTTFNVGQLIPVACWPTIAGDTFQVDQHLLVRTTTPVVATMDELYLDLYAFWDANRNLWNHFKEFIGENRLGAWAQVTEYSIPQLLISTGGITEYSLYDYFGHAIKKSGGSLTALPNRLYVRIVNEFFRDQNIEAPLTEYYDDTDRTFNAAVTELGGEPYIVNKYHDYFTSGLPSTLKSPTGPVTIPIGVSAPVIGNGNIIGLTDGTGNNGVAAYNSEGIHFGRSLNLNATNPIAVGTAAGAAGSIAPDNIPLATGLGLSTDPTKSGMYADLSQAVAATINAQRYAFALQRIYESNARTGTRYRELLKGLWHVTTNNREVQIPEYLGGKRIPLQMQEIAQTSESGTTALGSSAGLSKTGDSDRLFTKSFVEEGWVIVLACVRYRHKYSQGFNRNWTKKLRFDFYYPQFAFLGERPTYNYEIFFQGSSVINPNTGKPYDEEVFNYNEAWAEYRYMPSIVCGEFRPDNSRTLAYYHYSDYYGSLPVHSKDWLQENKGFVDRTLTITSENANQIRLDYLLKMKATRSIPLFSVPSLLDHF